ncbi:bacteriohemerythrin [Candidatus Giovannonibacteria bacterium]|nr:bacteriohemerythrin [Candidatus Giovannonibacteria bacterium]
MKQFEWNEEYSVGIASIDDQHKKFFAIANEILAAREKEVFSRKDLSVLLKKLRDYALKHFKNEENYFDKLHYQGALHKETHNWYRKKVLIFIERLADPKVDLRNLAEEIGRYSVYWLADHILMMDKEYTIYFKEHGVK